MDFTLEMSPKKKNAQQLRKNNPKFEKKRNEEKHLENV